MASGWPPYLALRILCIMYIYRYTPAQKRCKRSNISPVDKVLKQTTSPLADSHRAGAIGLAGTNYKDTLFDPV